MDTKLCLITQRSARDPKCKFDALLHHVYNEASLAECFHGLEGRKAVGVDGIRKEDYAKNLEESLRALAGRIGSMSYRPQPVREKLIPKEGKPGATRPLGIGCFEDKIVQKRFSEILEAIYEPLFLDCSYGFRPGRSCHEAIKRLYQTLYSQPVSTVVDIDIKSYFDTIDHEWLMRMLELKISDRRFLRYIRRMLKAGILSEGELRIVEEGTPQGSLVSPMLSNIYLHYVLDLWFEKAVKRRCHGNAWLFRYADDAIACFELEEDAHRYAEALPKRMAKFGLEVSKEKSKIVHFCKRSPKDKNGPFNFLGFTFYMGISRKGYTLPKVKTNRKKFSAKLRRIREWMREVKDKKRLTWIWDTFRAKMRGHIQYYGVTFNLEYVQSFLYEANKIVFKWLNRRSQRKSFTWAKFCLFTKQFPVPKACTVHRLF
jgi:RNA-directed DNA polymerase